MADCSSLALSTAVLFALSAYAFPANAKSEAMPASASATVQALPGSNVFPTLPPGSALPKEEECAARVMHSPWEPRPDNAAPNHANVYTQGYRLKPAPSGDSSYYYSSRVTGNFVGTTDEIFQWSACKWGFDVDTVRAQAVKESYWRQSTLGDCRGGTVPETHGCQSVGILQIKGADIPPTLPGTWPYAYKSTAFNADFTLAVRRACFEGKITWIKQKNPAYAAGDNWGCIGHWFSGGWYDPGAQDYTKDVQSIYRSKPWLQRGF